MVSSSDDDSTITRRSRCSVPMHACFNALHTHSADPGARVRNRRVGAGEGR